MVNVKGKGPFWFYIAIGAIGAIGQAIWLRHELVDTYPYKMMYPLNGLYEQIGELGVILAPSLSIAATFIFLPVKRFLLPAVPAAICPIIFWIVFEYILWRSPSHAAEMLIPLFDQVTGAAARWLFVKMVLSLSGAGVMIGVISGGLVSLIESGLRKSSATSRAS
jgi:hypothetical protein